MVLPPPTAAALVVAGALLAAPAAAVADAPVLLAQLAQTSPESPLPPLVEDPPIADPGGDSGDGDAREPSASGGEARPAPPGLPDTGAEAWLVALLGTGMVLSGGGLRLTLADGRGRRR